jgi:hypothetical protein
MIMIAATSAKRDSTYVNLWYLNSPISTISTDTNKLSISLLLLRNSTYVLKLKYDLIREKCLREMILLKF